MKKIVDSGYRIQKNRFQILDTRFRTKGKKFFNRHLGSGIWYLIFGIWHLASRFSLFAAPVTNLSYTLVSSDTLSIQWDNQTGNDYLLVLSTVEGFAINLSSSISGINQNTTSFYNLAPNTSHTFLVKISTDDDSNYTAISTFTFSKSPGFSGFIIYHTSLSVALTNNGNPADSTTTYRIEVSTDGFVNINFSSEGVNEAGGGAPTLSVVGLTPNTTYEIRILALNFLNIRSSETLVASTATLPNPPTNSAFLFVGVTSITMNWNANGNSLSPPTSYQMQVSTDSNFTVFTDSVTFLLQASSSGLTPNTTYHFRVRTTGVLGALSSFDTTLSTLTLPASPGFSAFKIFATSATVTLQSNNNPAQSRFRFYASTDGFVTLSFSSIGVSNSQGTAPTLLLSGLAINSTYQIGADVIAFNNLVSSRTPISESTSTLALPPSNFSALVSSNVGISSISVNWSANGNPLTPPTSYQLQISTDLNFAIFTDSVTFNLFASSSGLTPNTSYYFRVRAFSRMGEPTEFNQLIATFTLAEVPTNLSSTQSVSAIWLRWQSNNPSNTRIEISSSTDNFQTQIATPIPFSANFTGTATSFANLKESASYFFRIRAINENNLTTEFSVILNTKTASLNPEAISGLSADREGGANQDGRIRLSWTAPADNGGTPDEKNVSSYIIRYATFEISAENFDSPLVSTYVQNILPAPRGSPQVLDSLTGLNPGTTYYFAIKAKDEVGNLGIWNPNLSISTFTWANDLPLGAPTNLLFSAIFSTSVILSWTPPPAPANVDDRDLYKIYYATYNFFATSEPNVFQTTSATHPTTQVTVTGLENETTYFFRVTAVDKGDQGNGLYSIALESALSAASSTITLDRIAPAAISDLTALTGTNEGEIILIWTAPGDDGTNKNLVSGSSFEIKYSSKGIITQANYNSPPNPTFTKNISTQAIAGSAQSTLLSGLVSNTTYWIAIKTIDESGNISVWNSSADVSSVNLLASTISQRDFTAPSAITNLTLTPGYKKITLTWTAPGDDGLVGNVTGYFKIKYDTASALPGGVIDTLAKYEAAASTISISTIAIPRQTYSFTITSLTNNTTYAFAIRTLDDGGNISPLQTNAPSDFPKNQPPRNFISTSPADFFIVITTPTNLSWENNPSGLPADPDIPEGDSVSYLVEYSTNPDFSFPVTTGNAGGTPNFNLTGSLVEDSLTFWRVKARDLDNYETISNTRTLRINLVNTLPTTFTLLTPANNEIVLTSTPTLDWEDSFDRDPGDGITYTLKYSQNPDAEGGTTLTGLTTSNYIIPSALSENTTYFWKVIAISTRSAAGGGQDEVLSNATFSFRINSIAEPPNAFSLISPQDGERILSLSPTFSWHQASDNDPGDIIRYELTIQNLNFGTTNIPNLSETTYTFTGTLLDNQHYIWRVKAKSSPDNLSRDGTPIAGQLIKVDSVKELPPAVILTTPTNQSLVATSSPTLKWTAVSDPDNLLDHPQMDRVRYIIKIGKKADYSDVLGQQLFFSDNNGFDTQRQFSLEDQTTYFWQVAVAGYQPIGGQGEYVNVDRLDPSTGIAPADCQTIFGAGAGECFRLSAQFSFIVSLVNTPPTAATLLEPQNNALLKSNLFSFDWTDSQDSDPAQSLEYKLEVSTDSNFSTLFFSTAVTVSSFTLPTPLLQNRTYFWRILTQDKFADGRAAGPPVVSAQTFSFKIPVLTTPKEPTGINGILSEDKKSFTLTWKAVTQNTDGSSISDLANYLIFRSQTTANLGSGAAFAQVSSTTLSYTDSTIAGSEFFYTIRAVNSSYQTGDSSGTISINSLVVKSSEDQSLLLVPEESSGLQGSIEITIPEEVKSTLEGATNGLGEDLKVQLAKTNATGLKDALFGVLLKIKKVSSDEEIKGFTFAKPIQVALSPFGAASAPKFKVRESASNSMNDYAIFWNNGVEWLNLGGAADPVKKSVTAQTRNTGEFAIRQVVKATAFELSALTPTKIFSPNGDGCNDIVAFQFQNPKGISGIRGKIFDLRGALIAEMKRAQELSIPAPHPDCPLPNLTEDTLIWDGKDSEGNFVRKGIYIYQIEAEGKAVNGTIVVAR